MSNFWFILPLNHVICKKKKNGVISNEKQVASSNETASEFRWLAALIENPQLCPSEAGENPGPPALINSPDLRNSWSFLPKSKLFSRNQVFHPIVVPQPLFRPNLLILKLMWQFVLNRLEQIFRCMFMSGSNGGGSCAN